MRSTSGAAAMSATQPMATYSRRDHVGRAAAQRRVVHEDRQGSDGQQEAEAVAQGIGELLAGGLIADHAAIVDEVYYRAAATDAGATLTLSGSDAAITSRGAAL